jgi:uncharacterized peroxidase-related enzyme
MARIQPISSDQAQGKAKVLLDGVEKKLGGVPNLIRTLAVAAPALEGYLNFSQALAGGNLNARLREQIAIAVGAANACEYCASAHTAIGKSLGLKETELTANLDASSQDSKVQVALEFARDVVAKRGWVNDQEVQRVRDAGYSESEIVEIIAHVALNLFTNYFNHIAGTEVDFPVVRLDRAKAA